MVPSAWCLVIEPSLPLKKRSRLLWEVLGFVAAPLSVVLAEVVYVCIRTLHLPDATLLRYAITSPLAFPFALVIAVILGAPAHYLWLRYGRRRLRDYAAGGSVVAATPLLLVVFLSPHEYPKGLAHLSTWALALFAVLNGAVAGMVFWLVAVRPHSQN